jgi:16S rRNA (adenine1518-N6/adenine1519-N6)-dimethyltransferase
MTTDPPPDLGPPPRYDLTDLRVVRQLERRFGMHARKDFSQHWLVDRAVVDAIAQAADLTRADTVLEPGAGMGVLTVELARRAGRVVAVEIERAALAVLREVTGDYSNVTIAAADLLQVDPAAVCPGAYVLAANLPYAITAMALRHFLENPHPPQRAVVLIQYEVAERIIAGPGQMSLLALSVHCYATPRLVMKVPASSFAPPPKVDSAVVALAPHPPPLDPPRRKRMFALARAAFAQRRKQMHNILPGAAGVPPEQVAEWLAAAGIAPDRRPQTLDLADWVRLTELDPRPLRATRS